MDDTPPQRKKLPTNPSLEHLQKQAKDRVNQNPSLQLAAAQHQIAQEYGFKNWAELARAVKKLSAAPRKEQPILCEQCGAREATVHWSTIVAKKKADQNLCTECAAARGLARETQSGSTAPQAPIVHLSGQWKGGEILPLGTKGFDAWREMDRAALRVGARARWSILRPIIRWLHLTADQRMQAANLWRRATTEVRSIRADDKIPKEQKSAQILEVYSAVRREFAWLLSNEQRNEFFFLYSQSFRHLFPTATVASQNMRELELRLTDTDDILRATLTLARELLLQGHTMRLRINFRGREIARTEIGLELLRSVIAQLQDIAEPRWSPKLIGRNALVLLVARRPPPAKSATVG